MKFINRFKHAFTGLFYAFIEDSSFRQQTYLVAIILVVLNYLLDIEFFLITSSELMIIIISAGLILITELQNSALESALDRLHPERHDSIKKSKDIAAGAVVIAGGIFFLVILLSLWR